MEIRCSPVALPLLSRCSPFLHAEPLRCSWTFSCVKCDSSHCRSTLVWVNLSWTRATFLCNSCNNTLGIDLMSRHATSSIAKHVESINIYYTYGQGIHLPQANEPSLLRSGWECYRTLFCFHPLSKCHTLCLGHHFEAAILSHERRILTSSRLELPEASRVSRKRRHKQNQEKHDE